MRPLARTYDFLKPFCWAMAVCVVALLGWIFVEIVRQAWPALQGVGLGKLVTDDWIPSRGQFGLAAFLVGTAVSSLVALLFAFPLGVSMAIFLSEDFLPLPARQVVRFTVEMLAAIPSVIYGLWGIFVIIPLVKSLGDWAAATSLGKIPIFAGPSFGNSVLAASLVLALMILPTITAISRSALVAVPHTLREGSYALGATRWETIFKVILPAASSGIVAATILALGRAMGETMAVAMLIGNSPRLAASIFAPGGTLASLIANQFGEARGMQVSALMFAALLLVAFTLLVNAVGEYVLRRTQHATKGVY